MELHNFVVCAYGESKYLEECIKSLLKQTVRSKILITTSTPSEFINELGRRYHLEVYINRDGRGIADDWNFAYAKADSKYVTLAHQDDIYEPNYVEMMLKQLKKANKPLIFFSDYGEIRQGKKVKETFLLRIKRIMLIPMHFRSLRKYRVIKRGIVAFGNAICCPAVTYVKDSLPYPVFEKHFKSNLDWEAWERISEKEGSFEYCDKVLMYHRIHKESETSILINNKERIAEDYEMLCRFWPAWVVKRYMRVYGKGTESNHTLN